MSRKAVSNRIHHHNYFTKKYHSRKAREAARKQLFNSSDKIKYKQEIKETEQK